MPPHKLLLWGLIGVAAGVYLAGASGGTGIYSLPLVGATLENTVYSAGNSAGGGSGTAGA